MKSQHYIVLRLERKSTEEFSIEIIKVKEIINLIILKE